MPNRPASSTPAAVIEKTTGTYVASRTGKAFYFPWCGAAKRISDKNKIWFDTRAEAEKAGYTVGKCKGLK